MIIVKIRWADISTRVRLCACTTSDAPKPINKKSRTWMLSQMSNMYLHCTYLHQHYNLDVGCTANLRLSRLSMLLTGSWGCPGFQCWLREVDSMEPYIYGQLGEDHVRIVIEHSFPRFYFWCGTPNSRYFATAYGPVIDLRSIHLLSAWPFKLSLDI